MTKLELKISASLKQALDKLKLSSGNEENKKGKILFCIFFSVQLTSYLKETTVWFTEYRYEQVAHYSKEFIFVF